MSCRHLHRCALRFPRTLDEAFRTPRYGASVEKPLPKKPRIGWGVAAWIAFAIFAVMLHIAFPLKF